MAGVDPGFQSRKFVRVSRWSFWKWDRRAKRAGRSLYGYFPVAGLGGGGGGCKPPNWGSGQRRRSSQKIRIFTSKNGWLSVDSQKPTPTTLASCLTMFLNGFWPVYRLVTSSWTNWKINSKGGISTVSLSKNPSFPSRPELTPTILASCLMIS